MAEADATRAAEAAARTSRARLVAFLARRTRNLAAAEDAVADAFRAALETWPNRGVPAAPEAWLLMVARRAHGQARRRAMTAEAGAAEILRALDEAQALAEERRDMIFPDDRLRLLFAAAHPAVDAAARTPLLLQAVLGLPAHRIASAFLVSPATLSQRLVRAKERLREAGTAFEEPDAADIPARLETVMEAVFAAFGTAWDAAPGADDGARDLREEAIWLGETLVALLPDEPEPKGLLALMLHADARRAARRVGGVYIPLEEQDATLWDHTKTARADALLRAAGKADRFGRFQCEAAIQSVHAERRATGRVNTAALVTLYAALAAFRPTPGVLTARAAATLAHGEPEAALDLLAAIPEAGVAAYQPFHATRAAALAAAGRADEARAAYDRAIGLSEDASVRDWLAARRGALS
ncbi:MAG: RNA polymerase subunit sigma-70 [Rhodobacteraceae bacterium]|nr:RNA polymerase subunit sigma-70 [Paracoccaceae bacterium]